MSEELNFDLEASEAAIASADEADLAFDSNLLKTVEIQVEALEGRQRRISAQVTIPCPVEQVWQVLSNYEALTEFVPNLAKSQRLDHPTGGIRLEQVGTQRLLRMNFSARVVLDVEEKAPEEMRFTMVEGDFKAYSGTWQLQRTTLADQAGTKLCYTVLVWPKRTMPVGLIESRLRQDLPVNLLAIRQRVIEIFGS